MSLVLDLHIDHDRFGSSFDPSLNDHLHYPNDIDKSLHETTAHKIRKYRPDYNHDPPTSVSLIKEIRRFPPISLLLLVRLGDHMVNSLETDYFFAGVQFTEHDRGGFHYRRVVQHI